MSLGVDFEVSSAHSGQPQCHSLFLLLADPDVKLSATSKTPRVPVLPSFYSAISL